MPAGIDDNYDGVPNVAEEAGPEDQLRDLLMKLLQALGPGGDEGASPAPEPEMPVAEEAAPMPEPGVPGAEESSDPKAKLLQMLKAKQGGM